MQTGSETKPKRIFMLAGKDEYTAFFYNGLAAEFAIEKVIIEEPYPRDKFIKRRIKRMGLFTVGSQLAFQVLCVPLLRSISAERIKEIKTKKNLSDRPIPSEKRIDVPSINSEECLELIKREQPDILIVQGTRIIGKRLLNAIKGTIINTHAGITPKYRGVHGAYWAMANNDPENCGVTVHLVDPGIDTGGVLFQERIETTPEDNFATYTYTQARTGIELMKKALNAAIAGTLQVVKGTEESQLHYHPTIWKYLYLRIFKGVK